MISCLSVRLSVRAFVPIDPMNVPPKFKKMAAPGYAHAPFSQKFLWAFIRIGPVNVLAKLEVRSFTYS